MEDDQEIEETILSDFPDLRTVYTVQVTVPTVLASSEVKAIALAMDRIASGEHTVAVTAMAIEKRCQSCGDGTGDSSRWYCSQSCKADVLGTDQD